MSDLNKDGDGNGMGSMEVHERICQLLNENKIEYKRVVHEPTRTSEESARVRGEELSTGGKAILMKVDDTFYLFVVSASKKLNSKRIKEHLKAKKIRFSTTDELFDMLKLVPGSVPPFAEPIMPIKQLYVDKSILCNQKIAFNAGLLTHSVVMNTDDYLRVAKPELFDFSDE